MIAFLTVVYILVLFLLIKLKVVKPTKFAMASPVLWVILLFIVLFIPLQSVAPAGRLQAIQNIVQIVPQVSGIVVDVPVQPNVPVKRGDVLFRIEPRPYQYTVDKLEAALAAAGVNVSQLEQRLKAARAAVEQARAQLLASETDFERRAREALQQAEGRVAQVKANLKVAQANYERFREAAKTEAVSQLQLDQQRRQVESLQAQLAQAEAAARNARLNYEVGSDRTRTVQEQLQQALAREADARLAYEAQVGGYNPRVRQIIADLERARFDLENTVVRAPADGVVVNLQLRPGDFAGRARASSSITFVESGPVRLGVLVRQNFVRLIQPGDGVEMVFEKYPGRVFPGRVITVIQSTAQGQLTPSGVLPAITPQPALPFVVRVELTPEAGDVEIPGGAMGTAAVYTDTFQSVHVIRKVMVRMDTWLNYVRGISL